MLQAGSLVFPELSRANQRPYGVELGTGKANVADGEAGGDGSGDDDVVAVGVVAAAVGCGVGVGVGVGVGGGGMMFSQ